jgi:sec-independent protein translocase protein TatA
MNTMLGIFNLGGGEIILILAVVLIMFGAKKLPELAKGLGQGIKEFKKATREVTDEMQNAMDDNAPPANPPRRIPPAATVASESERPVASTSTPTPAPSQKA